MEPVIGGRAVPPRGYDTAITVQRLMNSGVEVTMITGDHLNIAIETARPRDCVCDRGDPVEIFEQKTSGGIEDIKEYTQK